MNANNLTCTMEILDLPLRKKLKQLTASPVLGGIPVFQRINRGASLKYQVTLFSSARDYQSPVCMMNSVMNTNKVYITVADHLDTLNYSLTPPHC